ncbi:A/G-specific adenine glycosylase [PVC group bacterium]|nr:A/G-specific adenine glycosylase [PVC group bacterium]
MPIVNYKSFAPDLLGWFKKNARALPWRDTNDPYLIWISEVMLQQTIVSSVIPYFEKWKKKFPTIEKVAKAPLTQILRVWQGLGYYQRARNIHKASRAIVLYHGGRIPDKRDILEKLPGFGPYTTCAVLSIAYGQSHTIIDANVRRVFMRILGMRGAANVKSDVHIRKVLISIMPKKSIRAFNEGLMELGALVCRPAQPICHACPVSKMCRAYDKGLQEIIPKPKIRVIKKIEAVVGIIKKDKKVFIQKRPEQGLLAGLWEFPGGKREPGETLHETLKRELKEELSISVSKSRPLMRVKHAYTQFSVDLHAYTCLIRKMPRIDKRHKFVAIKDLNRYPMPSGSAKIVRKLQNA